MDSSPELSTVEGDGDGSSSICSTSSTSTSSVYRLFGRQTSIHRLMGGGKAADVLLWRQNHVSCGVIIIATVAWLLLEWSELSFLSVFSNVLLLWIVSQYVQANYAVMKNKQLQPLPQLVLSEEMVNSFAASFRAKLNHVLLMARDITLGKDFKLFFKVVVLLWLLSAVGSLVSLLTLAYIGTLISITIPALYNKYEGQVDHYSGLLHQQLSKHYKNIG